MRADSFTGVWWLPQDPERHVAGTLHTEVSKNPRLELIGSFGEPTDMNGLVLRPAVNGVTNNGKRITLVESYVAKSNFSAPGIFAETLEGRAAVVGAHFDSPDEIIASKVYASFSWLPEWIGWGQMEERVTGRTIAFEFTPPEYPLHGVGEDEVGFASGWTTRGRSRARDRTILPTFSLKVVSKGTVEAIVSRRVQPFQNFLTLATGLPNVVVKVEFQSAGGTDTSAPGLIELLYPVTPPEPSRGDPIPHDMLFSYQDVESDIGDLLRGWYGAHDELADVCALFFSARAVGGPNHIRFLNLIRALEVYDRIRNRNEMGGEIAHQKRIGEILVSAPDPHRDWLDKALKYSNEPSLRQRGKRLMAEVPGLMEPIAGKPRDFIALLADSRHYYTHYDPSLKSKAAQGPQLSLAVRQLEVMISALLLGAAGLQPARITALFRQNQDYMWLQRKQLGRDE
ncbi:hypothetical protein BH20CHL7_BH20CHL7_00020 [soil metagenome]